MRKKELAKKWRKVFSAILAATVITTSAVPESLVLAADAEETQGFGDSESMGAQSGQDENSEWENQDTSDIQNENPEDTENMTDGFTDDAVSFSSEDGISVEAGFQSQATVEEIQERINALPTVEEFQKMADGTTVEDSTLNQKQTDVYNEAQAIADALDLLSEEEQGLVDNSKLEGLFEYFNSMTEETVSITKVKVASDFGNITSKKYYYTESSYLYVNIYIVQSGTYVLQNDVKLSGALYIASGADVTIDLNGYVLDRGLTEKTRNGFGIDCKGTLTLKDSSANQTGVLTGAFNGNTSIYNHGGAVQVQGGTFILESGTISGNRNCYAGAAVDLFSDSTSKFIMKGASCIIKSVDVEN